MKKEIISMRDISISFGTLNANDKVNLSVNAGEIMALLGENGAGKTTLMKILYGLYSRDKGSIVIDGVNMPDRYSSSDAIKLGIFMVPQHFMLVDEFSVAENVILGEEDTVSHILLNKEKMIQRVEQLCKQHAIDLDPRLPVRHLSLGQKQKVEILKALFRNTKIIILDEPTTVLTPQEVEDLFVLLRRLQKKGVTVIFITHKLNEVMMLTDRITVMRRGKTVALIETKNTDPRELSRTMVGQDVQNIHNLDDSDEDVMPIVTLQNVCTKSEENRCKLSNLTIPLYPGKIVGVAGIDGNGQKELVEIFAGIKPISNGVIEIYDSAGKSETSTDLAKLNVGIIPEDRHSQGLILDFSIRDNILLGYLDDRRLVNKGIFRMRKVASYVEQTINKYDIRPPRMGAICRYVSGGNQQKVVLGRELERQDLKIVVASQPVRGLDVGAMGFTHRTLLKLREQGKAILLISSDLDEIKTLSDYIAVIRQGTIVAFERARQLSKDDIGLYMGGSEVAACGGV